MPTVFEEPTDSPTLRFTFDDDWRVVRLDEDRFFRRRLMPLQLTGAVDFLGVHRNRRELWLIEVKDYRGSRIELKNAEKMHSGDRLLLHVARKVKDSVACIVGAARHSADRAIWRDAADIMHQRTLGVKVVLWLEVDFPQRRRKIIAATARVQYFKQEASIRTEELKRHVSWITRDVLVTNQSVGMSLPGITVENVGRAGAR